MTNFNETGAAPFGRSASSHHKATAMRFHTFENATDFLALVGKQLTADEIRHGLMYSQALRLKSGAGKGEAETPWYLAVTDRGTVCAAILRTPPHNLISACFTGDPTEIAATLGHALENGYGEIPGVVGDAELVNRFSEYWCGRHGLEIVRTVRLNIHKLESVNQVGFPDGIFRLAAPSDRALIARWSLGFHRDIVGDASSMPVNRFENRIETKDLYLWEDGVPVALAGKTRPIGNGISIGPVYTPPEARGRGYATACVARLCRLLLQSGYRYCALYADGANPTAGGIYRRIGFFPVCDSVEVEFGKRGTHR